MIDRKILFDRIRATLFGGSLKPETVKGVSAILDEAERRKFTNLWWLAAMLGTVRRECGVDMLPVREGFGKTDAQSRAYVKRQGYEYAAVLHGHVWYGRGLVQLTWYDNYLKFRDEVKKLSGVDIVTDPDAVLRPDIAAYIMFEGMTRGMFTKYKLSDFDFTIRGSRDRKDGMGRVQARRIINGLDHAEEVADYCEAFHTALMAARVAGAPAETPAPAPVAPEPAAVSPAPAAPQSAPAPPSPSPAPTSAPLPTEKSFREKFGDLFRPKKD